MEHYWMEIKMRLEQAEEEMKLVFKDSPLGIEHTQRVLANAEIIMNGESISGQAREIVALACVLHDIGEPEAQRKHGCGLGHYQEMEGPPIARSILERIGTPPEITERICHIVGHHHTKASIDGIDFQVVWEADILEALKFEGKADASLLRRKVMDNFHTASGLRLAQEQLGIEIQVH